MSLMHWYEAAKFLPLRPDLRDQILLCPTLKEVRKMSASYKDKWRNDWAMVQHKVLIAGLGFLSLDRPDLELGNQTAEYLCNSIMESKLISASTTLTAVNRFLAWSKGPRISTFGTSTAPREVVGKKLSKVVQAEPNWTLVSMCNNKAGWLVHDWALNMYVPVHYVGGTGTRYTNDLIKQIIGASDQIVVFEVRGGKSSDKVLALAKAAKKPCTLELYRPEDLATRMIE